MQIRSWLSSKGGETFKDNEALFVGLRKLDQRAIVHLQEQAMPMVRKIARGYGLPSEKAEEILNDSTVIFLQKIESGAYQFEGYHPMTYCIEIAKRLALMATRTRKYATEDLEKIREIPDNEMEALQERREKAEMVHQLLTRLGDPCETVIRLYHIDGYSDEEVIEQKRTVYTTIDSLKMKRSICMKKLSQLAQEWKTSNKI